MSNVFVNLDLPAFNGEGAPVDVSGMGGPKTIMCVGSFVGVTIAIEVSTDGGNTFSPVASFQNAGDVKFIPTACQFMRTKVSGRRTDRPFAASCKVGAPSSTNSIGAISIPVGLGPGDTLDISAFPPNVSLVCTGSFAGSAIVIEISDDDAGEDWNTVAQFNGRGGVTNLQFTATKIRAVVAGRPIAPDTVVLGIAAYGAAGGGVTGTLTPGVLPYATGPEALGDSSASYDGSKIVINRAYNPGFDTLMQIGGGGGLSVYTPDEGGTFVAFCQAFRIGAMLGGSTLFDIGLNAGGVFNDLPLFGSIVYASPPVGGATINGLAQQNGFENLAAPFVFLFNIGTGNITLPNENVGSQSQNRFYTKGSANVVIPPRCGAILFRGIQIPTLGNETRWIVVAVNI